ncbi:hypothetical protein LCGC14_0144860 [marine sediment metagenome]|uniref:Uncharacterized protein n=1 Tax=marine sediment metagenome TaxID=412755 RepID=A0A0F9V346_9ZZZZ
MMTEQPKDTQFTEIPGTADQSLGAPPATMSIDDLTNALRYVFKLEGGKAQHKEDGVIMMPRGRLIGILPVDFREIDEEYSSIDVSVSSPRQPNKRLTLRKDVRFFFFPPEIKISQAYDYLQKVLVGD